MNNISLGYKDTALISILQEDFKEEFDPARLDLSV
jgi:hypothetical protein